MGRNVTFLPSICIKSLICRSPTSSESNHENWHLDTRYSEWQNGTVNSEIFARVLFSRNFAYAKFREN